MRRLAIGLVTALGMVVVLTPTALASDLSGRSLPGNVTRSRMDVGPLDTSVISAAPSGAERASEAVVFVHGAGGSSIDFVAEVSSVGQFARAVAFDMPGLGQAAKPSPQDYRYTVDNQAAFVGRALDRLGVRRVHLVLHDFGGLFGLQWAARHRDRVASLTLIDTGVPIHYKGHPTAFVFGTPVVGELATATLTRPTYKAALNAMNPKPLPEPFLDRMYDDFDSGTRAAVPVLYRNALPFDRYAPELTAALRPLDLPALVVWGKDDSYLPVDLAYRQRQVFPHARITVFPGVGHFPFADVPDQTLTAVTDFLRAQVGSSASR